MIRIEVVTTALELQRLSSAWLALERGAAARTVFQTFHWCDAWYRRYAQGRDGVRLHVVVGRRDGRAVMVWPLMATRHGGVWILKFLSDPFAQYGDILVDGAEEPEVWIDAAWSAIAADASIDGVSLRHVRTDTCLHRLLAQRCGTPVERNVAPYLDLTGFGDAAAYHAALSRNQRAKRSKLRKRLERHGEIAFAVYREGPQFAAAIARALDFKREWLATRGYRTDVLLEPGFTEFVTELGRGDTEGMTAAAGVLSRDGTPLSVDVGIHFKGEYFGYLIVQDQLLLDESPAKLHLDLLQKWTVEHGFGRFDLMAPDAPYKMHWANATVAVDDFALATTLEGRLYCSLYLKTLRPHVKRLYHALPMRLRRPLVDLMRTGRGKTG